MSQLIFIDDSGDPGFKVGKGSTRSLVIALVIFDNPLDAEETALAIKRLRERLGRTEGYEFRFHDLRRDYRVRFLTVAAGCPFRVRAIVMPKGHLYGRELRQSKEAFYNYAIKTVLKHHGGSIQNAKIRLDSSGEKALRHELAVYLRRELNTARKKVIQDVKFRDSKRDVLIQLADMVAGAIRRHYDAVKDDAGVYRDLIAKRIEDEWIFGE